MKSIALHIMLIQAILCFVSCEKDFVYDDDCETNRGSGSIGGWENPKDTTITSPEDTLSGNFVVDVNEWGDTIYRKITF